MAKIPLTEQQQIQLRDSVESGLEEAREYLLGQCPELGEYVARALLFQAFKEGIQFDGTTLDTVPGYFRE